MQVRQDFSAYCAKQVSLSDRWTEIKLFEALEQEEKNMSGSPVACGMLRDLCQGRLPCIHQELDAGGEE